MNWRINNQGWLANSQTKVYHDDANSIAILKHADFIRNTAQCMLLITITTSLTFESHATQKAALMNANKYFIKSTKGRRERRDGNLWHHEKSLSMTNTIQNILIKAKSKRSMQTVDVIVQSNYLSCLHALIFSRRFVMLSAPLRMKSFKRTQFNAPSGVESGSWRSHDWFLEIVW